MMPSSIALSMLRILHTKPAVSPLPSLHATEPHPMSGSPESSSARPSREPPSCSQTALAYTAIPLRRTVPRLKSCCEAPSIISSTLAGSSSCARMPILTANMTAKVRPPICSLAPVDFCPQSAISISRASKWSRASCTSGTPGSARVSRRPTTLEISSTH